MNLEFLNSFKRSSSQLSLFKKHYFSFQPFKKKNMKKYSLLKNTYIPHRHETGWMWTLKMTGKQSMRLVKKKCVQKHRPLPPLHPMQMFTWETREHRKPLKREASWRGRRHWWGERRGDSWERQRGRERETEREGGREGRGTERELIWLICLFSFYWKRQELIQPVYKNQTYI